MADGRGREGFRFALRLNAFALVLTAVWTPLNTLLLPGIVEPLAPSTLRGTALGALTLVGVGVAVLVQPLAGAFNDSQGSANRRRAAMAWPAVAGALLIPALWFAPSFVPLLAVYLALQCALNVAQAAFQALIPEQVEDQGRALASGVKTALDVGGNALGLALAGAIVVLGGPEGLVLALLAALCLGGAALAWYTVPPTPDRFPRPRRDLRPGTVFAPLFSGPAEFRLGVLMRFLFLLGLYPVQRFLLYYLEDRFDIEDPLAGAAGAIILGILVAAAGGLLAGFLDPRVGTKRVLVATTVAGAVGLAGLAGAPSPLFAGAGGLVLAFAAGGFQAANWGMLARDLPEKEGARYFGLVNAATAGASAIAGAFGPLVDVASAAVPGATYQVLYGLCALVTLSALLPLRGVPSGEYRVPSEPLRGAPGTDVQGGPSDTTRGVDRPRPNRRAG